MIHLLSDWISDPAPKRDWVDLPKVIYGVEQEIAATSGHEGFLRTRYGSVKLCRCRNCGIRIPEAIRIMPWKACSEDCADQLWIRSHPSEV